MAANVLILLLVLVCSVAVLGATLRFDSRNGEFKILQVADMHYADGKITPCQDVLPRQVPTCSDLNTTAFIRRMILAEKPHLIVFTGLFFPRNSECLILNRSFK